MLLVLESKEIMVLSIFSSKANLSVRCSFLSLDKFCLCKDFKNCSKKTLYEGYKSFGIEDKFIERGKYFRILADIRLSDGRNVSEIMLFNNHAVEYDGGTKNYNWCS